MDVLGCHRGNSLRRRRARAETTCRSSEYAGDGHGMAAFNFVPQTGAYADQLRKNLKQIKLPPGFKINLYAVVPDARHMAVGPQGIVTFVGTRKDSVWAVTDRNKDGTADEVKRFAPSLDFVIPNGVCFSKDGFLYVAERNRVRHVPGGRILLREPRRRGRRCRQRRRADPRRRRILQPYRPVCAVGPGQQALHPARPALQRAAQGQDRALQEGRHRRHHPHGPERRQPRSLRHRPAQPGRLRLQPERPASCGPTTTRSTAWATTSRRASSIASPTPGQEFGFPWYGGGHVRTNEFKDSEPPADVGVPGGRDGCACRRSRHGVLHRQASSRRNTRRACSRPSTAPGTAPCRSAPGSCSRRSTMTARPASRKSSPTGWLTANGEYIGRPVALAQLRDGSLLVSDDFAGAIYRISYGN